MIAPPPTADPPPPPVVIPPPKQRSERSRRRRRGLIAFLIILILGIAAGIAGWWYASGRYSRVPDVRGQSVNAASSAIESAGYHAGTTSSQFSETVPKGAVISTDPRIGVRLPRGKTIALVVSLGKDRIVVPDVHGESVPDAQAAMQARGLHHVETERSSETVPRNKVIGTDPAAGRKVKRDQVVKIIISTGPPVVAIPDIESGTSYSQAVQTLRKAGFPHTKRVDEYSDDYDSGEVISISPTGREVKGSTITLTVSKGPHLVTVPQVHFGDQLSDVETALTNAGLTYDVERYSPGGTGTLVLKISPKSGELVKIGSTVVITAF
jgi:serine/threonine-protein kinase